MVGFNNRNSFLIGVKVGKSRSISSELFLPGWQMVVFFLCPHTERVGVGGEKRGKKGEGGTLPGFFL